MNNRAPVGPSGADERVERVLRFADERGSGTTLREFVARALRLHLQVRGYQWTVTITPPTTKALALIAFTPHEHERGLVTTWVAPRAFAEHFPKIAPDRLDEELAGIADPYWIERILDRWLLVWRRSWLRRRREIAPIGMPLRAPAAILERSKEHAEQELLSVEANALSDRRTLGGLTQLKRCFGLSNWPVNC